MQLRRVALVHASAVPGGGADRVTEHVIGARGVTRIDAGPLGVYVTVAGQPRVWIPLSSVRWGECIPEVTDEPTPLKAVDGGKRVKR